MPKTPLTRDMKELLDDHDNLILSALEVYRDERSHLDPILYQRCTELMDEYQQRIRNRARKLKGWW